VIAKIYHYNICNHSKCQKTTCQSDYLQAIGYQIFKNLYFLSKNYMK